MNTLDDLIKVIGNTSIGRDDRLKAFIKDPNTSVELALLASEDIRNLRAARVASELIESKKAHLERREELAEMDFCDLPLSIYKPEERSVKVTFVGDDMYAAEGLEWRTTGTVVATGWSKKYRDTTAGEKLPWAIIEMENNGKKFTIYRRAQLRKGSTVHVRCVNEPRRKVRARSALTLGHYEYLHPQFDFCLDEDR